MVCVVMSAGTAAAQRGVLGGVVKDENGESIKGATVRGQNPDVRPSTFTATSDDKGRFAVIGLRTGLWTISVEAPGFYPGAMWMNVQTYRNNPRIQFTLKKDTGIPSVGALGGVDVKALQTALAAARQLFNEQRWEESIAAYRAILARAPAISTINLQIGSAYRSRKDYDGALAAYNDLLRSDPTSEKARVGIGMISLEKGDLNAAEDELHRAAASPNAGREVFFALGEVKLAQGQSREAVEWYQKAADVDPRWARPWFKLGLVALNNGDAGGAAELMKKVTAVDPTSREAAEARAFIEQVKP